MPRRLVFGLIALVVVVGGAIAWFILSKPALPPGFASGNGRLEATETYIASKTAGRVLEAPLNEGDDVQAGQVIAKMDTEPLEAQLRQAQAKVSEAQATVAQTQAQLVEAQDNRNYALAQVDVKKADLNFADKQYGRSKELVTKGAVSQQEGEIDFARLGVDRAELIGSQSQAERTVSNIEAAKSSSIAAQAAVAAAKAEVDRLNAEIKDSVLTSPIRGRIETRLAEPGEVLPAGGRVYSVVDLADVYMYVFLPEQVAGKVAIGSQARIVLDAAPDYPIVAVVTYVSPVAQFTPKTVETKEERHNLSFRVKLQVDRARLSQFEPFVKVGIPGMGYVRFDNAATWPAKFEVKNVNPAKMWSATGSGGQ
jgi:HlyD family secretion protein